MMLMLPSTIPPPAAPSSSVRGRPPASAISHSSRPSRAAVLRLGCLRISRITTPKMPIQRSFWSRAIRRQWEKITAPCSTMKGLISSEGCSCTGPSTSQRLAPLTVVPTTRVAATSRAPTSRAGAARCSQRRIDVRMPSQSRPQLATSQMA